MSTGVPRATRLAIVILSLIFALVAPAFLVASRDTPTAAALSFGSTKVADEVELGPVRAGLLEAVRDAVPPTSASVWLRGQPR